MDTTKPVFGLILLGGSLSGALVRDVRLANELARRGYDVHVWWAVDRPKRDPLVKEVRQHWLFHGMRYMGAGKGLRDRWGRLLRVFFSDRARAHYAQKHPRVLAKLMTGMTRAVVDGLEKTDPTLTRRFGKELETAGVTHLLPMLEILCAWAEAGRRHMQRPAAYLVTFQGYELYSTYARAAGLEEQLYEKIAELVDRSNWPAIAVSADYKARVVEDVHVPASSLVVIPPGVPAAPEVDVAKAQAALKSFIGVDVNDGPIVAYIGRQDNEKGIDLLLHAAAILKRRGVRRFQLAIAGPTLFGRESRTFNHQLAENLRLKVHFQDYLPEEVRNALFALAHCVVYPSVHREPFGLVAAEAASFGTPTVVPDYGGVADAIRAGDQVAGLTFRAFDSGDLADKLEQVLTDGALHHRLHDAGPAVAEHYSVANMGARVLKHLGVAADGPAA